MVETLITTDGCYVGIFDLASRVHQQENFSVALNSAKSAAAEVGQAWAALYYFNEEILACISHTDLTTTRKYTVPRGGPLRPPVPVVGRLSRTFFGQQSSDSAMRAGAEARPYKPSVSVVAVGTQHAAPSVR